MSNHIPADESVCDHATARERQLTALFEDFEKLTSRLAHDIRGPLNLVSGYSDLLAGERPGPLNPEQKQFVERIRKGAREVGGMIERCQEQINSLRQPQFKPKEDR